MSRISCASLLAALLFIGGLASPAAAQSVLVTRGLGFPVEPLDARARGLGGIGIGLPDGEISWVNPAGLYGMPAPGMVAAYQYDDFSATAGDSEYSSSTARFPYL